MNFFTPKLIKIRWSSFFFWVFCNSLPNQVEHTWLKFQVCKVWTYGSKVMRFLRFQAKFGHVVSHYLCSKICPKLPKSAQRRNFEIPPKIKVLVFFKNKNFYM
jgi:hypothetical protein